MGGEGREGGRMSCEGLGAIIGLSIQLTRHIDLRVVHTPEEERRLESGKLLECLFLSL